VDDEDDSSPDHLTSPYFEGMDTAHLPAFFETPYALLPRGRNEVWVIVPRFVPFYIGHLERQTESYNYFVVNKYVDWISPLPDEIREKVGISPLFESAKVADGIVTFSSSHERDRALRRYRELVDGEAGACSLHVRTGREFELIARIIDDGNLPFVPSPVESCDIRPPPRSIELRDYQHRAWETFVRTGMVGIYWPPSAGKTFFSLYCGERINGNKLVIVPSVTLREQWEERIRTYCRFPDEWQVHTYQYLTGRKGWVYGVGNTALTIFDEVHHLPATTFSRLATIRTTYRIGLSASPYREDGRTEYIFALTGFPIGLGWHDMISIGAVSSPDVTVYLYSSQHAKRHGLISLAGTLTGRVLIFCDSLRKGQRLSLDLNVPFIHGGTADRMNVIRSHRMVICSRVGDEGLSLPVLDTVIEYDFLGGSRRQEAQRVGRVMHSAVEGEHIILMTDEELHRFERRLYALEEQGLSIRCLRGDGPVHGEPDD
jgi:DNA excision repair protein ERCC-3